MRCLVGGASSVPAGARMANEIPVSGSPPLHAAEDIPNLGAENLPACFGGYRQVDMFGWSIRSVYRIALYLGHVVTGELLFVRVCKIYISTLSAHPQNS